MRFLFKNSKGFTLVEILLYLAIASIILGVVSIFLLNIIEARVKNQVVGEVEMQGAEVLQTILQTGRNASSISSPTTGATGVSLTLVVPTGALSPTVFDQSAGSIRIQEGAGAAVNLTNSKVIVSNLNFTNLSRTGTYGNFRVIFTLSSSSTMQNFPYVYSKTFYGTASLR